MDKTVAALSGRVIVDGERPFALPAFLPLAFNYLMIVVHVSPLEISDEKEFQPISDIPLVHTRLQVFFSCSHVVFA